MAKKATSKGESAGRSKSTRGSSSGSGSRAVARTSSSGSGGSRQSQDGMGDAFIKLLQSPLVADLLAVAATAALAALAEHGFSSRGAPEGGATGRRASRAVKEAGKAAAAAIGRRLSNELQEIRAASKKPSAGAEA